MQAYLQKLLDKVRNIHKSWTLRFNALMAALPFALDYAQSQFPLVRDYLPTNYYGPLITAVIVGNVLLRFKTKLPLEQK